MRTLSIVHVHCTIKGYSTVMNRREFIGTAASLAAFGSSVSLSAERLESKKHESAFDVIFSVQRHFFPKGLATMPDADTFNAARYTEEAIEHKSFDPDIRAILFEGAKRLQGMAGESISKLTYKERERLLRKFEEDSFGSYWLSQVMNLTLEALLSDPIYGGNVDESGWRSFGLKPGLPRPKKRYCGV